MAATLATVALAFAPHDAPRVGLAGTRSGPLPSTFEQSESERRWGASGLLSPETRDELDRLERTARGRAAELVGLSPHEIERVTHARRAADARRGELEAASADGPLRGRALARMHAAAREEVSELERAICPSCARALLAAEREVFRELLAARGEEPRSATRAFIERRMMFLRMGLTPADAPASLVTACAHARALD